MSYQTNPAAIWVFDVFEWSLDFCLSTYMWCHTEMQLYFLLFSIGLSYIHFIMDKHRNSEGMQILNENCTSRRSLWNAIIQTECWLALLCMTELTVFEGCIVIVFYKFIIQIMFWCLKILWGARQNDVNVHILIHFAERNCTKLQQWTSRSLRMTGACLYTCLDTYFNLSPMSKIQRVDLEKYND